MALHDVVVVAHRQVDGLADLADEAVQQRAHVLHEAGLAAERIGQYDDPPAEHVEPVVGVLPHVAAGGQAGEQAVRGAFGQLELGGDVLEADTLMGLAEEIEHIERFGDGEIGPGHVTPHGIGILIPLLPM